MNAQLLQLEASRVEPVRLLNGTKRRYNNKIFSLAQAQSMVSENEAQNIKQATWAGSEKQARDRESVDKIFGLK